ncbi:MAG TPA: hypothetical protein VLC74_08345 [Rhizomicrobium sp.]|nr:hypothetical protein [Rhizomicrobium sp.]
MNRYYFNFREGGDIARDRIGMYLPDIEAARDLALRTCQDLAAALAEYGDDVNDGEMQVADASGEPVLRIPLKSACH